MLDFMNLTAPERWPHSKVSPFLLAPVLSSVTHLVVVESSLQVELEDSDSEP